MITHPLIYANRNVHSGTPVIAGRRIPCWAVFAMFMNGKSIRRIANDYHAKPPQIEAAIRWEAAYRQARKPKREAMLAGLGRGV